MMHPSFICGDDSLKKIGAVQNWLKIKQKTFSGGVKKRLNRCIEVDGDYVEK
jgi:hypothetical protein